MNDKDAIFELHQQWLNLERTGNTQDVLRLCSDDVLWLVQGTGGLRGHEAVAGWLKIQSSFVIESLDTLRVNIEVSGNLAVKTAEFQTTLRASRDAEAKAISGTHLWTLRKEQNGQWRVTSVGWSISDGGVY